MAFVLYLILLKMEQIKNIFVITSCFVFIIQKKSVVDAHRIICKTYGENVIAIRTCANWFKQFKKR